MGFEPTTYALRVRCSTTELSRRECFFSSEEDRILFLFLVQLQKLYFQKRTRVISNLKMYPERIEKKRDSGEYL